MGAAIPSSARASASRWIRSCLGWCPQPRQPGSLARSFLSPLGHQGDSSAVSVSSSSSGGLWAATPDAVQTPQLWAHLPLAGWHWATETQHGATECCQQRSWSPWSPSSPSRAVHGPGRELPCRALHSWNSRALQQTNVQVYNLAKAHPGLDPMEKFRNCSANIHGRCGNLVTG